MDFRIIKLTNQHWAFYRLMGPYLSRRAIVNELGSPVWDDDNKVWFVAIDDQCEPSAEELIGGELDLHRNVETEIGVLGFVAFRPMGKYVNLCSDYVEEHVRKAGVYRELSNARDRETQEMRCKSVVTEASLPTFLRLGFKNLGRRGRFFRVEKTNED